MDSIILGGSCSSLLFSFSFLHLLLLGPVLFAIDGPLWAKRRKLLSSHFSISSQKRFWDVVFENAISSAERLEKGKTKQLIWDNI